MLELSCLSKSFGKKNALQDITLTIGKGECFGLLGPNGAGKTTLVNLVCGYLKPDSGKIIILEKELAIHPEIRRLVGVVPQEAALYENLTVLDNLKYFGELYGLSGKMLSERIDELLQWIKLFEKKKQKVKFLSGGMKRRINLIAGLLHSPRLLLVDEPTVGVDPQARLFIYELIENLKMEGISILYTTHYIPEVEQLCGRVAILDEGKIAAMGTKEELGELESAFFQLAGKDLRE